MGIPKIKLYLTLPAGKVTLKGFFKMVILNKTRTLTSKNSKNKRATSVNQIDLSRDG
jgi:hypothetical protein